MAKKGSRKQLAVVCSKGTRQRFLRGMITHDLVQRGLGFDDAFDVASAVRDGFEGRGDVSTDEIRERIQAELVERFGRDLPAEWSDPTRPQPDLHVLYHGERQPFSRGLLARSVQAAGVELDRAYRLVTLLYGELREEGLEVLDSSELARRMAERLEREVGIEPARRYRLVRRIHRLPRPLILYLGGASGTGKSTLSLELAPLLRIYRVTATDTVRQVMRMVFSPQVLPALHTSSFEPVNPGRGGGPRDRRYARRLRATFEEQAERVAVGLRAVVERAIVENMSIVVEGVHLYPPLVPFDDLEGAAYQVMLMLGTRDRETHRARFLSRARRSGRRAERYLEHFDSIRLVHDFVLEQAESYDVPLLDTSYGEPPVGESLRLITDLLQRRLPSSLRQPGEDAGDEAVPTPTLLLIIDGLGDRPVRALGGRTPLAAAATPTLDRLAREGRCGLADPVAPGVVPDTAAGSLALFGQSPQAMKRGPIEALGAGIELSAGDIALRGNFASVDERGTVIDRRAGRIRVEAAELAAAIDRLTLPGSLGSEIEVRVSAGTEHRLAVVLRGDGLSSAIQGSDPGDGAVPGPALTPRPLDPSDERGVYTARVLALFEQEARRVLADHPVNLHRAEAGLQPANAVLTRGAGRVHRLLPLETGSGPLRLVCISGDRTLLGIASWVGAMVITGEAMTANLDTDLGAKFDAALDALGRNELVVVHVKGADIAAHDQRPELKLGFLEQVDRQLARLLARREEPLRVAVASDHATLSDSGQHAADPLPVLIWGAGIEADEAESFDEQSVTAGDLGRFPLQMLLGRLFDLS